MYYNFLLLVLNIISLPFFTHLISLSWRK